MEAPKVRKVKVQVFEGNPEKKKAAEKKAAELTLEAHVLLESKQFHKSEAMFESAISLSPRPSVEAYIGHSKSLWELGRIQEALTESLRADQISIKASSSLRRFQASCYERQLRFDKAIGAWKSAIDLIKKEMKAQKQEQRQQLEVDAVKSSLKLCQVKKKEYLKQSRGFRYRLDAGDDVTTAYEKIRPRQPYKKLKIIQKGKNNAKNFGTIEPEAKSYLKICSTSNGTDQLELSDSPDWDKDNFVRVVCVSDTHNRHNKLYVPPGDILIHAGDFTMTGRHGAMKKFGEWLSAQPHTHKLVIAGNHDVTLDPPYYERRGRARFHFRKKYDTKLTRSLFEKHCTYLEDQAVEIEGYKFYGSPISPSFCDWAFGRDRGPDIRSTWEKIPDDCEILITHGPALGHGDECRMGHRAGCMDLLHTIQQRVRPMYHIFGHIHEDYGVSTDGYTKYVNASTCTFKYLPYQPAIVFDLPRKNSIVKVVKDEKKVDSGTTMKNEDNDGFIKPSSSSRLNVPAASLRLTEVESDAGQDGEWQSTAVEGAASQCSMPSKLSEDIDDERNYDSGNSDSRVINDFSPPNLSPRGSSNE